MFLDAVGAVLGWAAPESEPESLRFYALDNGAGPRWQGPDGRTIEKAFRERGSSSEGRRAVVVLLPREVSDQDLERVRAALIATAGEIL
jgi:hypothetical protein